MFRLLPLATAGAESEEFERMKERPETLQVGAGQVQVVHRAVGQGHGGAAVHTGEVMFIPLGGGEQGLAAGQVAAAHQAPLLELAQIPVHGGQPHGALAPAQAGVEVLPAQLPRRLLQLGQQPLLADGEPGAGGRLHGGGGHRTVSTTAVGTPAGWQVVSRLRYQSIAVHAGP